MAKFLNTSATNYFLEELIKDTKERLVIISPFLKFNDRIKELLADKDRMKIDIRIIYGKSELAPKETNWLRSLEFVRTSFCQNLHAKCYLNEHAAIITSMNLYDFSQVNNNEMGVYIRREDEPDLYRDAYEETQRLLRVSDQVRLSAEEMGEAESASSHSAEQDKLPTSKIARAHKLKTAEFTERLVAKGLLRQDGEDLELTEAGIEAGGEFRLSSRFGKYFLWPKGMTC